jgi:2-keto-4-pentenoate hydratase/2-oxohepta-3-ene-1,7-dioic acid hydratase in catechol pathway
VKLLVPLDPLKVGKVLGVAGNTAPPPPKPAPTVAHPTWFAKFATGLVGDNSEIEIFPDSGAVTWEGELVLVIGRKGRYISVEDAPKYVFGVAVGNDVTELEWYTAKAGNKSPGVLIGKAADTWSGIGSAIVTGIDYRNLRVTVTQNGKLVSDGRVSELINGPAALISHISRYITLMPGDLIYTGLTRRLPDASGRVAAGDELEIEIEQVGKLRQKVVLARAAAAQ